MSAICPTCGQRMPETGSGTDPDLLLRLLKEQTRRQVYRGKDTGRWLVTYRTGGEPEFTDSAVRALIARGEIRSCYSDCPDEAYWRHATIDVEAAKADRRRPR